MNIAKTASIMKSRFIKPVIISLISYILILELFYENNYKF